jgi:hypothetical protein
MNKLKFISILILVCLVTVEFPPSTYSQEKPAVDDGKTILSQTLYSDPKGFFKIRPPEGWFINEYATDPRGKVDFNSSNSTSKAQLKIIGQANPFPDFDALLTDCRNGAERMRSRIGGTSTVKEIIKFNVKAVEVQINVPGKFKQLQYQILIGKNYYTFAFGGTPEQFDRNERQANKSIETFEPIFKEITTSDYVSHIIASKIRTAELYLSINRKDWALVVINEGLQIDKQNKRLLELKDKGLN